MTEWEATLIAVAREAAVSQGWILQDCIYSVRKDESGWIVQVDRAPGYPGVGEPSVVVDGTFFVHIDGEGRPTRLLSHGSDVQLEPHAPQLNDREAVQSATQKAPAPGRVALAFDQVNLENLVPFLTEHTGKDVVVSAQFKNPELNPKYTLTLVSRELMSIDEAFARIMAKLRADGLDVRESEKTIEIDPGNYVTVWKPDWMRQAP